MTSRSVAEAMGEYISEAKLTDNLSRRPEMQFAFTERQLEFLPVIQERLLALPLIHGTTENAVVSVLEEGIQPYALGRTRSKSNTHPLDVSLGLDNYTFMNWGNQYTYERHLVHVDAHLLLDHTIVTDFDIAEGANTSISYDQQSPEEREWIQKKYFDKMLFGRDWLDIVSRRVLRHICANKGLPYPLTKHGGMGEVKYLGAVAPGMIVGTSASNDIRDLARHIADLGFVDPDCSEQVYANTTNPYEYIENICRGELAWKTVLDVELGSLDA